MPQSLTFICSRGIHSGGDSRNHHTETEKMAQLGRSSPGNRSAVDGAAGCLAMGIAGADQALPPIRLFFFPRGFSETRRCVEGRMKILVQNVPQRQARREE